MSVRLNDEFTVPVPVERAWEALRDARLVAACLPGAVLDSVEGERATGRLRVRIGSTTVTYRGEAEFGGADPARRRVEVRASGREARGPGTASAAITARLSEAEGGAATRVAVSADLTATGRAAGFGPDVLARVGARLVARFAARIAAELGGGGAEEAAGAGARVDAVVPPQAAMPEEVTAARRHGGARAEARLEHAAAAGGGPGPRDASGPPPAAGGKGGGADTLGPALRRALPVLGALVLLAVVARWLLRRCAGWSGGGGRRSGRPPGQGRPRPHGTV